MTLNYLIVHIMHTKANEMRNKITIVADIIKFNEPVCFIFWLNPKIILA